MAKHNKIKLEEIPFFSNDLPLREKIVSGTARYVTWLLLRLPYPVSAAQVTFASALFALLGGFLSIFGDYALSLLGLLSFYIFILLDHVDGQVARVRGTQGPAGMYLDSRTHHIVEPIFLICLGIGASGDYALFGVMAAVFYLMRQTVKAEGHQEIRRSGNETSLLGKLNYWAFEILRISQPFGLMFWAILFNLIGPALVIYSMAFLLNLIISFYSTWKKLKETEKGKAG